MKRILLFTLTLTFRLSGLLSGQIIHVPDDQPSIQAAINAASVGDTVLVAEGTYFENINFSGKAITVASQFLIDEDTSHISSTIIDGSQAPAENATVVSFENCIDTTSVLAGFTITGGKGSTKPVGNNMITSAGGISIENAGGKVINNILRNNEIVAEGQVWAVAAGIGVTNFGEQYNSVIRNNKFHDNHTLSNAFSFGAGISVHVEGGFLLIENNEVYGNISESTGSYKALGAGMEIETVFGTEPRIIIRNNHIHHNQTLCTASFGGGIYVVYGVAEAVDLNSNVPVEIYNNIISDNYSQDKGGGLAIWNTAPANGFRQTVPDPIITNNTIVNNRAADGAGIYNYDAQMILINNILWNDLSQEGCREVFNNDINYGSYWTKNNNDGMVWAYYNLFPIPFSNGDEVISISGIFGDPELEPDSSGQLTENSPVIGRAIDSLEIKGQWYVMPEVDYYGNNRPDAVDRFADLGAIESPFTRPLVENSDLGYLGLWDRVIQPVFHPDTLTYMLSVPDTVTKTPTFDLFLADVGAELEVREAKDIFSSDYADRTSVITVTADDGATTKVYSILFNVNSTEATLSGISLSLGMLEPIFDSEINHYQVRLPCGSTETPLTEPLSSDSSATVTVTPALDVTNIWTYLRITNIKVVSEEGERFRQNYNIEFNVELCPALNLISDTVDLQHDIQAISSADGWIFLVPENTPANLDDIKNSALDSVIAISNETVNIPTIERDPDTYAVYAVSKYGSVSESVDVTISPTGLSIIDAPSIRIYPNPVYGKLHLIADTPIASVQIFNTVGTRVLHLNGPMGVVDMGELDQGPYFIVITTESGLIFGRKIMKVK